MAGKGFARAVHLVEQVDEALVGHFGQALGHALAQAGAVSRQGIITGIDEGKAVLGAVEGGNAGRCLA